MSKYVSYLEFCRMCHSAVYFKTFEAFKCCFGSHDEETLLKAWKKAKNEN